MPRIAVYCPCVTSCAGKTAQESPLCTPASSMLHDAAQELGLAVGDGVQVELDRAFEEAIEQHRVPGPCRRHLGEGPPQGGLVVDHLHGAAAQHKARPQHDGIADPGGHARGVVDRRRRAPGRRENA
jgi:hypothetical protein